MSPKKPQGTPEPEEETPLLRDSNAPRTETPLPITQIVILLLLQLCEPITSQSIKPYINQLVSELPVVNGDERKVGYYAGLIMSLFYVAQAVTVLQWSRLSDRVGRKPVLLCGLLGTVVSSILFGLSRSFSALVFSRCLHGVLNGNIGVMKSMLAELTDDTNMARGFSLIPVTWAVGDLSLAVCYRGHRIVGQMFSRTLSGPNTHTSCPVLATSAYGLLSFSLAAVFLKETVSGDPIAMPNTEVNRVGEGEILDGPVKDEERPLPLRALLTRPVMVSIANYGVIAVLDITAGALMPLVWSTSVEFGGLSMSPTSIGLWISGYGFINGIFQFVALPRLVGRFRPPAYLSRLHIPLFPSVHYVPPREPSVTSWRPSFSDMGFGVVAQQLYIAVSRALRMERADVVSIQRAIGPAAAASLSHSHWRTAS
ncbi:MFS general substrate transporter [Lactarius vividus]|nr:MFS general substrate transporter [Lactarius vividus]